MPSTKLRKKPLHNSSREITFYPAKSLLQRMEKYDADGFYRENIFGKEIIWSGRKLSFTMKKARKARKNLFLFALVKKDATRYLKDHDVKKPKVLPAIVWNKKRELKKDLKLVGTDADNAYWNIAYKMGVISENTYAHGLRIDTKELCLAALSSLGADKVYRVIKAGKITEDTVIIQGDQRLKDLYQTIRNTCFKHMQAISRKLKNDFIGYRTDCIYYVEKDKNIKIAQEYLTSKGFDFKMLREKIDLSEKKY